LKAWTRGRHASSYRSGTEREVFTMAEQQDTQRQQSPLHTERGDTTIQDSVVSKVAGIAAQEVDGVRMGGEAPLRPWAAY